MPRERGRPCTIWFLARGTDDRKRIYGVCGMEVATALVKTHLRISHGAEMRGTTVEERVTHKCMRCGKVGQSRSSIRHCCSGNS